MPATEDLAERLKPVETSPWLYEDKEGTGYAEYRAPPLESTWETWIADIVTFILVHYLFWGLIFGLIMLGIYNFFPPLYGTATCTVILALYLWKFFDGTQYTYGKPWHSLRKAGFWHWVHRYINLRVVCDSVIRRMK